MQRNNTFNLGVTAVLFPTGWATPAGFFTRIVFPENWLCLAIAVEITLQKGDFGKTTAETAEEGGVDGMGRGGERVEDHFAGAPGLDQAGPSQVGEVARDLRLWDAQDALKLANAVLPLREEVEKTDAGCIGKSLK